VFDRECALINSDSICTHAAQFYPQGFEEPIIFWEFDSNTTLPATATITQKDSESGDTCHYNIEGLSRKESKSIIYGVSIENCFICEDGVIRPLTAEDLHN
jgi:hypothetical protein